MEVSNINWEDFFQAINHPALILDSSHRVLAANMALKKNMGLSDDEIIGEQCFKLIHGPGTEESPFCCPLETLVKQGINETVEMEMESFGGYSLVSCTPIFDENGDLDKIIHIATDITQQKNVQNALEESEISLKKSERSYRELVDNSLVGIFKTNLQGDILFVNDAMVDMYSYDGVEELKEGNITKLYKNNNERLQFINKLKKEGHFAGYELKL